MDGISSIYSKEIAHWYLYDVQKWRTRAAVAWTLILSLPATVLYLLLVNISITRPWQMLTGSLFTVLHPQNWVYLVVLTSALIFQAHRNFKYCSVVSTVRCTRLEWLITMLCWSSLVYYICMALAGVVASWCLCGLIGGDYWGLTSPCDPDSDTTCLHEKHLFLMWHGLYLGLMFGTGFILTNQGYMTFPITQQAKYFQVKSQLLSIIKQSVKETFKQVKYFYVIYYFTASFTKEAISAVFNVENRPDNVPINSWRGVLDLGLLWQVMLAGSLVRALFSMSILLYKVYQTEAFEFPVESNLEVDKNKWLSDAMGCVHSLQVQFLGFQDLALLSRHSPVRRRVIYSLSQPGGHPHNWNSISHHCLQELDKLTNQITLHNDSILGKQSPHLFGNGSQSHNPPPENISFAGRTAHEFSHIGDPAKRQQPRGPTLGDKMLAHLKQRKAVTYFFEPIPDSSSRKLFVTCQKHIWAVQAISNLSVASYREDSCGVVQKTLPGVTMCLLKLQDAIEKHFKLTPNLVRRPSSSGEKDVVLRFTLRSEVKSALYRIAATFDKHISALDMPLDQQKRISSLSAFRE